MFGIEGWNEGFDLLRTSTFLWNRVSVFECSFAFMKLCFVQLGSDASQELRTTTSNARSSIYLKTERLPSFLVGSCSCVEQKVCWRSDLG